MVQTNIEHRCEFVVAQGCIPVAQGKLFFVGYFWLQSMKDLVVTQFVQR